MSKTREAEIADAFVTMASTLAKGYDVIDLLDELVSVSAQLLDVQSAGLLLADAQGTLHVMAASSAETLELEAVQLQRDDGPCLDCYHAGTPVTVPDLDAEDDRWPRFAPAARAAGFVSVHAVPMRLQARVLGTLGLFGTRVGTLNDADHKLAQALADVASVSLVNEKASDDADLINQQLQHALDSRVAIEQAKGIIAQALSLDMTDAFALLRGYARNNQTPINQVAQALADRSLKATALNHSSRANV